MALEAVVYSQDPFTYPYYNGYDHECLIQEQQNHKSLENNNKKEKKRFYEGNWDSNSNSPMEPTVPTRRKRRRTKTTKNKQEIENQRMTHIAVERNRRKQMNEYLSVLRSLMPPSYVQRGDQASIIGGSINFVKELEQLLQSMEAQKKHHHHHNDEDSQGGVSCSSPSSSSSSSSYDSASPPFSDFFSFPQYSTNHMTENVADIEVTMMETHANLKIRTKKRPRQLLKLVASFQSLRLTVLHLNVSTLDQTVLYSVSVKVEEGCQMNTVDEIAGAVNQIIVKIQEESTCCF